MKETNYSHLKKKRSAFDPVIEEISEKLQTLFSDEKNLDIDHFESSLTPFLDLIRKKTTEEYFESRDIRHKICKDCNGKMRNRGKYVRKIVGLVTYQIHRRCFHCSTCNQRERPLDAKLGLSGHFSLEIRKAMLLLGQRIPFQEASDYLLKLLGVQVSDQTILSTVESVGQRIHQEDQRNIRKRLDEEGFIKASSKDLAQISGVAYLQMDGMMVQTREEGWKEVRNGILFCGDKKLNVDRHHNWIEEKTCFSVFNRNKNSLEAFKRRATTEAHAFGFGRYEKPVIVGDGAKWIWDYAEQHHPEAIQILDYYHASEYLGNALKTITITPRIKKKRFDDLWRGEVSKLIVFLENQEKTKEVKDCIRYFRNHKNRMNYRLYREKGLDIGSGAIESTHRTLVQSRMKQAGMHWKKKNVQSIISVKARYHSGRWQEVIDKHLKAA